MHASTSVYKKNLFNMCLHLPMYGVKLALSPGDEARVKQYMLWLHVNYTSTYTGYSHDTTPVQ